MVREEKERVMTAVLAKCKERDLDEQPLLDEGWEVIVFIPSKEEDEDRITCGNALLSIEKS